MYLDRWGRRKTLMLGAAGMSFAQLIVATLYAVYKSTFSQHPEAGWAACVFVWIYIATFAFSIACVNWIMPSEMFPPATRSKAVGVAIATNYLSNFIVALITPRMLKSITFGTFYFFLVFCILLGVWTYFCVPETKGKYSCVYSDIYSVTDHVSKVSLSRRWINCLGAMMVRRIWTVSLKFDHVLALRQMEMAMLLLRSARTPRLTSSPLASPNEARVFANTWR